MQVEYSTKEQIFRASARLFADMGYDAVSMKTIARSVGIQAASIYNHYPGKEAILHAIYDHYLAHEADTRLTREAYEPIVRQGTPDEIMGILNYDYQDIELMFSAMRLVWMRIHIDPKARDIYHHMVFVKSVDYVQEVLGYARAVGRIAIDPEDLETLTHILVGVRVFSGNAIIIDPDQVKWRDIETNMNRYLTRAVTFNPPLEEGAAGG